MTQVDHSPGHIPEPVRAAGRQRSPGAAPCCPAGHSADCGTDGPWSPAPPRPPQTHRAETGSPPSSLETLPELHAPRGGEGEEWGGAGEEKEKEKTEDRRREEEEREEEEGRRGAGERGDRRREEEERREDENYEILGLCTKTRQC